MKFEIHTYQTVDCVEIVKLFYETVHAVNAADYTKEQLDAWTAGSETRRAFEWNLSFLEHTSLTAKTGGKIIGFADMDDEGYLDRLYIHKDYQRIGVAAALVRELESHSDKRSFRTFASITAKPFFKKQGYRAVKEQQVNRNGILLTNFLMVKEL